MYSSTYYRLFNSLWNEFSLVKVVISEPWTYESMCLFTIRSKDKCHDLQELTMIINRTTNSWEYLFRSLDKHDSHKNLFVSHFVLRELPCDSNSLTIGYRKPLYSGLYLAQGLYSGLYLAQGNIFICNMTIKQYYTRNIPL